MRNLFTRFLLIVFLTGIVHQTYAGGSAAPVPPLSDEIASLWPEDESVTQAQPGPGNVFVLEFAKDLHATAPFGNQGVLGLMWDDQASGIQQIETINPVDDPRVTKVGSRTVEVRFNYNFEEGEIYHITVEDDAIRFADGTWFEGISYDAYPDDPHWSFMVDDTTPPQMADCNLAGNVNGEYGVDVNLDPIVICFDEPVTWAPGADPYKVGNIAFYLAAKEGLNPNDEFGGDVIYAQPNAVVLYDDEGNEVPFDALPSPTFSKIEMYVVGEPDGGNGAPERAPATDGDVWPANRDIYLRFAADLLVDLAGNPFAGIHGSPFDPYSVSENEYWFSTRDNDAISVNAKAVLNGSFTSVRTGVLWQNDDILVTIGSGDLEFMSDTEITPANVKNFIKLTIDGNNVSFTAAIDDASATETLFRLDPGTLPEKKTIKVEVLADQIQDNNTTIPVLYYSKTFTTGDFSAPLVNAEINNEECTNFHLRVTSDEAGKVYYAMVKEPLPEHWNAQAVTAAEILSGVRNVVVGTTTYTYYFNHVEDPDEVTPVFGQNLTSFIPDEFGISGSLTALEHIDDFTDDNNGDSYRIYYFSFDPAAQGPYNTVETGLGDGRVSAVANLPVQLTDCLEPDLTWFYQEEEEAEWTACGDPLSDPRIKKDSPWKLDFVDIGLVEPIKLVNENLSWEDVVTLDVREYPFGAGNTWMPHEIASIEPVMDGEEIVGITVTPQNNYPSGGRVRIRLASGSIEDMGGNAINEIIECRKNIEFYDDPWIDVFTVESKALLDNHELFTELNGVVAKSNGKITVEFNNPIFTPKRNENVDGVLEPISLDPSADNYVGHHFKLHEGDEVTASITSNLKPDFFTYELYDANGDLIAYPGNAGVKKIVATPKEDYASEIWYYMEIESLLQDENRRELQYISNNDTWIWDNNLFVDLHELNAPYPAGPFAGDPPYTPEGNSDKYSMIFRAEDTVAPQLHFVFEKFDPADYPAGSSIVPYIVEEDNAFVDCVNALGYDPDDDDIFAPVGAIITEWSKMGIEEKGYYIEEDPNGLRPYFKMYEVGSNNQLTELDFDVVVLNIFEPNATGPAPYEVDAVWFGFVPFNDLAEGKTYAMRFNPTYVAEGSPLGEKPVFIDDNGNPLAVNTYVEFNTCIEPDGCLEAALSMDITNFCGKGVADEDFEPSVTVTFDQAYKLNTAATTLFTLWQGTTAVATITTDDDFNAVSPTEFVIPFDAWGVTLDENVQYRIELHDEAFVSLVGEFALCDDADISFWTPDESAPEAIAYSPDIDHLVLGTDNPATAISVDVRNPGKLSIRWNEKVSLQPGKVIHLWENGNTKRFTFVAGTHGSLSSSNVWSVTLEEDALVPNTHYHVEVEAGFVIDCQGNPSAHRSEERRVGKECRSRWSPYH